MLQVNGGSRNHFTVTLNRPCKLLFSTCERGRPAPAILGEGSTIAPSAFLKIVQFAWLNPQI